LPYFEKKKKKKKAEIKIVGEIFLETKTKSLNIYRDPEHS